MSTLTAETIENSKNHITIGIVASPLHSKDPFGSKSEWWLKNELKGRNKAHLGSYEVTELEAHEQKL